MFKSVSQPDKNLAKNKEEPFFCLIVGTTRKLDFGFPFSPLSNTAQAALTILSSSLTSQDNAYF